MRITITDDTGVEHDATEWVKALYDAATESMDWGSGFLDTGDVAMLRSLSKVCGFQDVDYPEDRCLHCEHEVTMHYRNGDDPEEGGKRQCIVGWHERHNAERLRALGRDVPEVCQCPGYVRREVVPANA